MAGLAYRSAGEILAPWMKKLDERREHMDKEGTDGGEVPSMQEGGAPIGEEALPVPVADGPPERRQGGQDEQGNEERPAARFVFQSKIDHRPHYGDNRPSLCHMMDTGGRSQSPDRRFNPEPCHPHAQDNRLLRSCQAINRAAIDGSYCKNWTLPHSSEVGGRRQEFRCPPIIRCDSGYTDFVV